MPSISTAKDETCSDPCNNSSPSEAGPGQPEKEKARYDIHQLCETRPEGNEVRRVGLITCATDWVMSTDRLAQEAGDLTLWHRNNTMIQHCSGIKIH